MDINWDDPQYNATKFHVIEYAHDAWEQKNVFGSGLEFVPNFI